ncbi:hypothetical protein [Lentzea sp. NBRC 102530]|uniref:hypothetical protein n=1 Tax=Lentzea sp. NBRC 102530 TaxID=3032201 RepID=UPI0024A3CC9F|nr:hypothetical protein [Lentzea sp. NBRC 102530]GLY53266.1 hypothetical protein Lesp01_69220 [Lentzea sp. NBRC 102530]
MSSCVFLNRPGEDPAWTFSWNASVGMVGWVKEVLARLVPSQALAAKLLVRGPDWLAFNAYDDDEVREMVRVIGQRLEVEALKSFPGEDDVRAHVGELVDLVLDWAGGRGFWGGYRDPFPLWLPRSFSVLWHDEENGAICFQSPADPVEPTEVLLRFEGVRELRVPPDLSTVAVGLVAGGYSLTTPDFPGGYVLAERFFYSEDDVVDWESFDALNYEKYVMKSVTHPLD